MSSARSTASADTPSTPPTPTRSTASASDSEGTNAASIPPRLTDDEDDCDDIHECQDQFEEQLRELNSVASILAGNTATENAPAVANAVCGRPFLTLAQLRRHTQCPQCGVDSADFVRVSSSSSGTTQSWEKSSQTSSRKSSSADEGVWDSCSRDSANSAVGESLSSRPKRHRVPSSPTSMSSIISNFVDDRRFERASIEGFLLQVQELPDSSSTGTSKRTKKKRHFRFFNQFFIPSSKVDGEDCLSERIDLSEIKLVALLPGSKRFALIPHNNFAQAVELEAESRQRAQAWVDALRCRLSMLAHATHMPPKKRAEMAFFLAQSKIRMALYQQEASKARARKPKLPLWPGLALKTRHKESHPNKESENGVNHNTDQSTSGGGAAVAAAPTAMPAQLLYRGFLLRGQLENRVHLWQPAFCELWSTVSPQIAAASASAADPADGAKEILELRAWHELNFNDASLKPEPDWVAMVFKDRCWKRDAAFGQNRAFQVKLRDPIPRLNFESGQVVVGQYEQASEGNEDVGGIPMQARPKLIDVLTFAAPSPDECDEWLRCLSCGDQGPSTPRSRTHIEAVQSDDTLEYFRLLDLNSGKQVSLVGTRGEENWAAVSRLCELVVSRPSESIEVHTEQAQSTELDTPSDTPHWFKKLFSCRCKSQ